MSKALSHEASRLKCSPNGSLTNWHHITGRGKTLVRVPLRALEESRWLVSILLSKSNLAATSYSLLMARREFRWNFLRA